MAHLIPSEALIKAIKPGDPSAHINDIASAVLTPAGCEVCGTSTRPACRWRPASRKTGCG